MSSTQLGVSLGGAAAEISSSVAGRSWDSKSGTNGTLGGGVEVNGSGCNFLKFSN